MCRGRLTLPAARARLRVDCIEGALEGIADGLIHPVADRLHSRIEHVVPTVRGINERRGPNMAFVPLILPDAAYGKRALVDGPVAQVTRPGVPKVLRVVLIERAVPSREVSDVVEVEDALPLTTHEHRRFDESEVLRIDERVVWVLEYCVRRRCHQVEHLIRWHVSQHARSCHALKLERGVAERPTDFGADLEKRFRLLVDRHGYCAAELRG